jgi:pimeloyl-ACP methyl ester carboxylesterase
MHNRVEVASMLQLNFKTFGQGPAVIILHGLFGSLDNWITLARKLAEDYSVYIIDQRNHGKSPHTEEFDYQILAEDLHHFMDSHGIYQAHLIGHSMGGKVVMQFASLYPERIDKLIVVDMAPKSYEPHHTQIFNTLNALDLTQVTSRKEADAYLFPRIQPQSVRQFLLKNLGRDKEKGFRWKFNLSSIYKHYPEILDNVEIDFPFDGDTLFLSGGASDYVLPEDKEDILELFPEANFVVLDGVGHWVHAEAPDRFMKEVGDFLDD